MSAARKPAAGALFLFLTCSSFVFAKDALTAGQQRGREIYRRGKLAGVAVGTAAIGQQGMPLSSSMFACSNCHGIWGEGSSEGGVVTPPLNWARLTAPAASVLTGRWRAAYSTDTLHQAIAVGRDPSGKPLHAAMPRFHIPAELLSDVIAYLKRIGDPEDTDPGVSPTRIRIGAALPLSGPLAAAGNSIRESLELLFGAASRDGGVYGRSIELVVEDSSMPSAHDATRRLVEAGDVFALVANLEPNRADDTDRLLETAAVPLIGPVTLSMHRQDPPNPYIFYLMPSLYDQARALVDYVVARDSPHRPRFAVIHAGTPLDQDVVEGFRRQAAMQGLEIVAEERDTPVAVAAILAKHPDYLLVAADGAGLASIAAQLEGDSVPALLGFISTSESGLRLLPPKVAVRALFAAPAFPPDPTRAPAFFETLRAGTSRSYPGLRAAAFAAGCVLVSALRSNGSRLSRDSLVRTVERLQHFETGVTAPLTFGPNQRVGSVGAAILKFDEESQGFGAVSDWFTPKN